MQRDDIEGLLLVAVKLLLMGLVVWSLVKH